MRRLSYLLLLCCTMGLSPAQAEERGIYLGGAVGALLFDDTDTVTNSGAVSVALGNPAGTNMPIGRDVDTDYGSAWRGFVGFVLHEYFAIELGYFGTGSQEFTLTYAGQTAGAQGQGPTATRTVVTGDYDYQGFTYQGVLRYPATPALDLFAKFGGVSWELDGRTITATATGEGTASGTRIALSADDADFILGAGFEYELGNQFGIRAEWERILLEGKDLNMFFLGMEYDIPM